MSIWRDKFLKLENFVSTQKFGPAKWKRRRVCDAMPLHGFKEEHKWEDNAEKKIRIIRSKNLKNILVVNNILSGFFSLLFVKRDFVSSNDNV